MQLLDDLCAWLAKYCFIIFTFFVFHFSNMSSFFLASPTFRYDYLIMLNTVSLFSLEQHTKFILNRAKGDPFYIIFEDVS